MDEEKNIGVEDTGNQTVEETTVEEKTSNDKTFTQDEVSKIVSTRLSEERKKLEREKQAEIEKATELAKLDSEAREKRLAEMHEQEIMEKDRVLSIRENKLEAIDIFSANNAPVGMVDYIVDPDKDKTVENANNFVKMFNEQVSLAVAEKLKGEAPKDVTNGNRTESIPTYGRVL